MHLLNTQLYVSDELKFLGVDFDCRPLHFSDKGVIITNNRRSHQLRFLCRRFFHLLEQALDDLGMAGGDVVLFSYIIGEIV